MIYFKANGKWFRWNLKTLLTNLLGIATVAGMIAMFYWALVNIPYYATSNFWKI